MKLVVLFKLQLPLVTISALVVVIGSFA